MAYSGESWIWWLCAMAMTVVRIISRRILFRSFKGLQIDDWIMGLFVTACYTTFIIISNKYVNAGSNLEPPGFDFGALDEAQIARRVNGSKLMIVVEQMQIAVIWSCKACLLLMYHRITQTAHPAEHLAIKLLAVYTALGYVAMEILYFVAWCRPFSEYYAVPTDSAQCITLEHHRIVKTVFNISADLTMLFVSLQMLIRSHLPWKRKIVLCFVFSLGLFAVAAASLNAYYGLARPYGHTWLEWYMREASLVILVSNVPFTWTILRELFEVGDFDESTQPPPWAFFPPSRRTTRTSSTAPTLSKQVSPAAATARPNSITLYPSFTSQDAESITLVGSGCAAGADGSPSKSLAPTDDVDHDLDIEVVRSRDFAVMPFPLEPS